MKKISKIIFYHQPHNIGWGGLSIIDQRNKMVLSFFCDNIIDLPQMSSNSSATKKILFYFLNLFFKSSNIDIDKIATLVENEEDTCIFISHSLYGFVARNLRRKIPKCKIVTFFHNTESKLALDEFKIKKNPKKLLVAVFAYIKELLSVKYSDYIVVLNERDEYNIRKIYSKVDNFLLLPTSLEDRYILSRRKAMNISDRLSILFVGTNYYVNYIGIKWMIVNIAKHVNADFYIVGKGMDSICSEFESYKNVYFKGSVSMEELNSYYYNSDIFISPLFNGGGMKTKIAEAMMFGLPIVGTNESFEGYNFDTSLVGLKTDASDKMIDFINELDLNRFRLEQLAKNSRDIFSEYYSIESSVLKMSVLFDSF